MAALGAFAVGVAAQMVSPEIDDHPFSYFSQSTDEIGIPYAKAGTEITPEGSLYTGYGELLFFVGPEQRPITARVRNLEEGYLPIFSWWMFWQKLEFGGFLEFLVIRSTALPTRFEHPENWIGSICAMRRRQRLPQAQKPISPEGWLFVPEVAVPEICT
jgi:hypothetical protein